MSDKITNSLHSAFGAAKESVGKAVGNEQLMASGKCKLERHDSIDHSHHKPQYLLSFPLSLNIPIGHAEKAQADARAVAQQAQQEREKTGQRVQGSVDELTGRAKTTLGAATGNTKMQTEGNLQETSGTARKTMNK